MNHENHRKMAPGNQVDIPWSKSTSLTPGTQRIIMAQAV